MARSASTTSLYNLTIQAESGSTWVHKFWARSILCIVNFFAETYYFCIAFFTIIQITDQFNLYSYFLSTFGKNFVADANKIMTPPVTKLIMILCFVLLLFATYCRTLLIKHYTILEEKLKAKEYAIQIYQQNVSDERRKRVDFLRSILIFISQSLKAHSDERISLYVYDNNSKAFDIVSRYSFNTKFNARSRVNYPADEGCIATAWQRGDHFYLASIDDDNQIINEFESFYKINPAISSKFSMLSRCIYAYRIDDDHNDAIAVLVFESKSMLKYTEDPIKAVLESYTDIIKTLVIELRSDIPTISTANEVGL